jgi:hypothetical protein
VVELMASVVSVAARERAQRERLRDLALLEPAGGDPARTSPSRAVKVSHTHSLLSHLLSCSRVYTRHWMDVMLRQWSFLSVLVLFTRCEGVWHSGSGWLGSSIFPCGS